MSALAECITSFPTSKKCTVLVYARGPWTRRDIENLVATLNLGLELGVYEETPAPTTHPTQEADK